MGVSATRCGVLTTAAASAAVTRSQAPVLEAEAAVGSVAAASVVVVATVDLVVGVGLGFLRLTVVREAIVALACTALSAVIAMAATRVSTTCGVTRARGPAAVRWKPSPLPIDDSRRR